MTKFTRWLRLPCMLFGLVLFFTSERYLSTESYFPWLRWGSVGLVVVSVILTLMLRTRLHRHGHHAAAKAWMMAVLWQSLVVGGILFYLGYSRSLGDGAIPVTVSAKVLLVLMLVSMIVGLMTGIGAEISLREIRDASLAEPLRVTRTTVGWMAVGLLLSGLIGFNFAGAKRDKSWDVSYLKITRPSGPTVAMVEALAEPLKITLFFQSNSDVLPLAREYFEALKSETTKVELSILDKDLVPVKAEELRVASNGVAVLQQKDKSELIDIGSTVSNARNTLKKLDERFQKSFLSLTQERKTAYFTRGHGELSWQGETSSKEGTLSLRILESVLRNQNYTLRLFGAAEGSVTKVPDDAAVVVVVGHDQPFLKEEVEALKVYLDRGGKLMVFLDLQKGIGSDEAIKATREADDPLMALLAETGIRYDRLPLANDKNFVVATRSPVDHWFIVTNAFAAHESVAGLSRNDERVGVLVFQAGSLQVTPQSGSWKAFETVRTLSDTFIDKNRNFNVDPDEKRDAYVLGAAASRTISSDSEARIAVFGDATVLSDVLVRNQGNLVFALDTFKWLAGESKFAGSPASEEDVKIQHTKKEDLIWFWGSVFLVPVLVLGAGMIATGRGRRKSREAVTHAS